MNKIFILLASLALLISCKPVENELDLLHKSNKWKGDDFSLSSEGVLELKGEFKSAFFHPGFLKTFRNFELSADILTRPGANASILFHTNQRNPEKGYEVIINNSSVGDWDQLLKTGSLATVRNVYYQTVSDNQWFNLKVKVVENQILISINGHPVVNYIEPEVPFRMEQNKTMMLGTGTIALKTGFKNSALQVKNLKMTPLPAEEKRQNQNNDFVRHITELHSRTIPVVDFHVHEKGDLTLPLLIERSAKLGINYGVAANCGLKFPIETNEQLSDYHASIDGLPIFKAMQAEGREWVDMFSPELVAKFDYAFTDAMTWTNRNGTRMRLWIPEETEVGDPEEFMEQLVSQIEKIVKEPISIYVNPTYLPDELADRYDELWTDERIERVINALKENNVALEINNRYQLPGSRVIQMAKKAGVKFAMGTNNTDSENLGSLEWAIQMLEEHQLQPSDMFLPSKKRE
jgi:hypothetical protein